MIHIINGQNDELMDIISDREVLFNSHKRSLENQLEQFDFECLPNLSYADKLTDRNRLIIPSEDEGYIEFIIQNVIKTNDRVEVYTTASYLDLIKAKVIYPTTLTNYTATAALSFVTNETEWRPGIVESDALRTITIDTHTNPFTMLKRVANEFDLELRFRAETDGNRVTNRYVDLLNRVGSWDGREVTFGKDLDSIERSEDTSDIYTALLCLGPEYADGNRLEVLVEDEDALQRWGRRDSITGELKHLIGIYEPQSERLDMTLSELEQYGRTELNKRINAVITYSANIVDLERVPGMENKKIRFGDTIRIKDEKFIPPLYVEARVFEQSRDIFDNSLKEVKLGNFVEFTEEQVLAIWKQLQEQIKEKVSQSQLVEHTYSKIEIDNKDEYIFDEGKTFAQAVGITAEDNAKQFATDQDGQLKIAVEEYADSVASQAENSAKSYAEDRSAQALQQALAQSVAQDAYDTKMAQIASDLGDKAGIAYVDGQLQVIDGAIDDLNTEVNKKADGSTVYTISEVDNMINNTVSLTQYTTDINGIVSGLSDQSTQIGQNTEAIGLKANQTDLNAVTGTVIDHSAQFLTMADEISARVTADYVQTAIGDIEVGGRNLLRNSDFSTQDLSNWGVNGSVDYQSVDGMDVVRLTDNSGRGFYQEPNNLTSSAHTLSFKARSIGSSSQVRVGFVGQNGYNRTINITSTWQTYIYSMPSGLNLNGNINHHFYGTSGTSSGVYITDIKLEKGNKATDWTPAPEDIEAEISSLSGELSVQAGLISAKADSSTVNALGTRVIAAESNIDGLTGEISTKVSTTQFNTLAGRVDTAETTISQQADEIDLKVNKNGVIGAINLSSEVASINASKINLVGAVTVLSDITGNLGTINAGTINGIDINSSIFNATFTPNSTSNKGYTRLNGSMLTFYETDSTGMGYYTDFFQDSRYDLNGISIQKKTRGLNDYDIKLTPNGGLGGNSFELSAEGEGYPYNSSFALVLPNEVDTDWNLTRGGPMLKSELGNIVLSSSYNIINKSKDGMAFETTSTSINAYDPVNIITPYASTQIGPRNSEYSHFKTSASNGFYFYDPVTIVGDIRLNGAGRVHNGGDGVTYIQGNTSVRATKYLSGTLTPMYASAFNNGSLASTKTDIKKLEINAIDILKNQAELYSYYLKGDIEEGVSISKMGFVIGEGYKTPFEVLSADGEAVEGYAHSTLNTKAIKELIGITDDHADRINFLEMENQVLKQRLNQLEGAA